VVEKLLLMSRASSPENRRFVLPHRLQIRVVHRPQLAFAPVRFNGSVWPHPRTSGNPAVGVHFPAAESTIDLMAIPSPGRD
jgi:hypothetical protein